MPEFRLSGRKWFARTLTARLDFSVNFPKPPRSAVGGVGGLKKSKWKNVFSKKSGLFYARESVYRWCTKGLKSVTRLPVRVRNLSKADK